MKTCPICKNQMPDWASLCETCWKVAFQTIMTEKCEGSEIVLRLKARAKLDLIDLLKEICKSCKHADQVEGLCFNCAHKEKENLVRTFLSDD